MNTITTRPFRVLADCEKIYQFLLKLYERDWRNGVPAPFLEYAYNSFADWMDISYSYKNRIWMCDGEIVAFCFYENPVTDIYFCLNPEYEALAPEMVAYADQTMPLNHDGIQLVLFGGQDALMHAAQQMGYHQESEHWDMQYDFAKKLDYALPAGFHFVSPQDMDLSKIKEKKENKMIDSNFRGAVYVIQQGRVLYDQVTGYADLPNKIPNTPDTRFASASAGKVFVATAICFRCLSASR